MYEIFYNKYLKLIYNKIISYINYIFNRSNNIKEIGAMTCAKAIGSLKKLTFFFLKLKYNYEIKIQVQY